MEYNKKKQAFTKEGIFRVTEAEGLVEYCRVKFLQTGNQLVFRHNDVKNLNFEDIIVVEEKVHRKAQIEITNKEEFENEMNELHQELNSAGVIITPKIIATNPKGDEIEVVDLDLFCIENKLDIEAVQAVLEGKQKTHKKWRFTV